MRLKRYHHLRSYIRRHLHTLLPFLTIAKARNILTALVEKAAGRIECRSRPFVFRVDPSTACNLRCVGCSNPGSRSVRLMLRYEDFETIIGKVGAHAVRISLYNEGEPLMNNRIYDMCRLADRRGISTLISTNFTLFRPGDAERVCLSRLTVLEPCLDGFSQEAYEQYRVGGDVAAVKEGIRAVMEEKRRQRCRLPYVDVQVILFDHVAHEVPLIKRFLRECGVDRVTFRADLRRQNVKGGDANPGRCFWLYLGMLIRPDGAVYPCCVRRGVSFGNILKESLDDIWNNKYYRFSRSLFSPGEDVPFEPEMARVPCLKCDLFRKRRTMRPPSISDPGAGAPLPTSDSTPSQEACACSG